MAILDLFKGRPREEKALQKQYDGLLSRAMAAQRNGDIKSYSGLMSEAEKIGERLDKLKQ